MIHSRFGSNGEFSQAKFSVQAGFFLEMFLEIRKERTRRVQSDRMTKKRFDITNKKLEKRDKKDNKNK